MEWGTKWRVLIGILVGIGVSCLSSHSGSKHSYWYGGADTSWL